MADVFISYASPDRERARLLADALEQQGVSVWWDREIQPGRPFDDAIEEALTAFTIRRGEAELTLKVDCPDCKPS